MRSIALLGAAVLVVGPFLGFLGRSPLVDVHIESIWASPTLSGNLTTSVGGLVLAAGVLGLVLVGRDAPAVWRRLAALAAGVGVGAVAVRLMLDGDLGGVFVDLEFGFVGVVMAATLLAFPSRDVAVGVASFAFAYPALRAVLAEAEGGFGLEWYVTHPELVWGGEGGAVPPALSLEALFLAFAVAAIVISLRRSRTGPLKWLAVVATAIPILWIFVGLADGSSLDGVLLTGVVPLSFLLGGLTLTLVARGVAVPPRG